eukprot:550486_1
MLSPTCILLHILPFFSVSMIINIETNSLYIDTTYGTILGYTDNYANIWSNIPFAAPPIDNLRFAPPQPHDKWDGILNTMDDPVGCIQTCTLSWWACPRTIDEGYSGGLLYNASNLVNLTDIILVTTNYRLGAQGFFYDNITNLLGNYGYLDQIFAMEWVYKNIEQFGGNKSDITIFGESAGGVSVATHLLNTSNTIIKAAIIESDPFGLPLRTTKTWGKLPDLFKVYAGCDPIRNPNEQLKCLRDISASDLLNAQIKAQAELAVEYKWFIDLFMPWTPTVGTGILNNQPIFAIQEGKYIKNIPIIAGVNENEGNLFVWQAFPTPLSKIDFEGFIAVVFDNINDAKAVLEYYNSYNVTNQSDYRPLLSVIATDGLFRCATRNISNVIALDKMNNALNYMYHFNHISSFNNIAYPNDKECWNIVCHGVELAYVFEPDLTPVNGTYTKDEWQLAQTMGYYWSSFAKNKIPGNGNPKRPVEWVSFINNNQQNEMIFNVENINDGVRIESNYDNTVCNFWDTLSYNWIPN